MADYIDYARELKARISIYDVISRYWEEPNYQDRVRCFIHNGKHKNMHLIRSKGTVHCFKCGEDRDIIGVVQTLYNLSFIDACKKLDEDFNCGLEIGRPLTAEEKAAIIKNQKLREAEKKAREIRKKQERQVFTNLAEILHKTEDFMLTIKPHKKSDPDVQFDLYFDCLKKVNLLEWFLDKLIGTDREICEYDYKYGTDSKTLYDKLINGEIKIDLY